MINIQDVWVDFTKWGVLLAENEEGDMKAVTPWSVVFFVLLSRALEGEAGINVVEAEEQEGSSAN